MKKIILLGLLITFLFVSCLGEKSNSANMQESNKYVITRDEYKLLSNSKEKDSVYIRAPNGTILFVNIEGVNKYPIFGEVYGAMVNYDTEYLIELISQLKSSINKELASELYDYARNDIEILKVLISEKVDPNCRLKTENVSVLYWACQNSYFDLIPSLIAIGAEVNVTNSSGTTSAFSTAINNGLSVDLLDDFILSGLDINFIDGDGLGYIERMLKNGQITLLLRFAEYDEVLEKIRNTPEFTAWLVEYWTLETPALYDSLKNKIELKKDLPLYHIAIDKTNFEAFRWVFNQGYDINIEQYFNEDFAKVTPLTYLEYKISNLSNFSGRDYYFTENSTELKNLRSIEDFISLNLERKN